MGTGNTRARRATPARAARFLLIATVVALAGALLGEPARGRSARAAAPGNARAEEVLVVLRPGLDARSFAGDLPRRQGGAARAAKVGLSGRVLLVRVPRGRETEFRARLAADPAVEAASLNYPVSLAADPLTPNDPQFAEQWNLAKVRAPEAWGGGARAGGVAVAVIDTGADYAHPDLQGALLPGCNFVAEPDSCGPGAAADDHVRGHGTHVAGIVAAATDNGAGVAGLAWGASVLPLKALDSSGNGSWFSITDAIRYAAQQPGVRAINLSLGSNPDFPPDAIDLDPLRGAIDEARGRGIVVVAAAGNNGMSLDEKPVYPASLPNVIAVAATDRNDVRASFSNYGAAVDIAAPGVDILSTILGAYGTKNGTSMAAPQVAALAALLASRYPALGPDAIKGQIQRTAVDLGVPGADPAYGWGRIDAAAALTTPPSTAPPPVLLTVRTAGTGAGTVEVSPPGGSYAPGTAVTLTARPAAGSVLAGWQVDGAPAGGTNPLSLAMDADRTVVATLTLVRTLTLSAGPGGRAVAVPPGPAIPANTAATVTAMPDEGFVFLGWTVDGAFVGWGASLAVTMDADRTVRAHFALQPSFADVPAGAPQAEAIGQLAARGIVRGYGDGRFGPGDTTLRAQMAALITRAILPPPAATSWADEEHANPFPDRGTIDAALWRNVGTLNHYGVARGFADGLYRPTGPMLQAQAISFITRAMIAKGYWTLQPDDKGVYPNVPAASGHRRDLVTYVHYAGAVPGTVAGQVWFGWDQPITRAGFAVTLWQALDGHFRTNPGP